MKDLIQLLIKTLEARGYVVHQDDTHFGLEKNGQHFDLEVVEAE